MNNKDVNINVFKYHVLCTNGKILVRIKIGLNLYFQVSPWSHSSSCVRSCRPFIVLVTSSAGFVES